jgi:hypothetical protein
MGTPEKTVTADRAIAERQSGSTKRPGGPSTQSEEYGAAARDSSSSERSCLGLE